MKSLNHILSFLHPRTRSLILLLGVCFVILNLTEAATPNPGHPWTEVGDGLIQFSVPTALRSYTLPDANATLFSSAGIVPSANGGTGNASTSFTGMTLARIYTLPDANATLFSTASIIPSANGGTGNASTSFTGMTLARTYTLPDASASILTSANLVSTSTGGTATSSFLFGLVTKMQNSFFSSLTVSSLGCIISCPIMSTSTANGMNPVAYDYGGGAANAGVGYPANAMVRYSANTYAPATFAPAGGTPYGIVIDSSGNVYVANYGNDTVTKITPTGATSTFATTGDGPSIMVTDSSGNFYTANYLGNNVSKITLQGSSSILGTTGNGPQGIALDSQGNVYTANYNSNNVSKITPQGTSTTLGTTGINPQGLTIDSQGNVYTADNGSNIVTKITPAGASSTLGTTGARPYGITIDSANNVYTANRTGNTVTKITPAGVSSTFGTTGTAPQGITIDPLGNIYTSNGVGATVTKITPSGASFTIGTIGTNSYTVTTDSFGNIYASNYGSNSVTKLPPFVFGSPLYHGSTTASIGIPAWERMTRTMSAYVDAGATTITNFGFPAAPTTSGILTSSSTTEGSYLVSAGSTSGTALGVISPAFTYVWRDWNPYFNTSIITATTSLDTARYWVGLVSAAPTVVAPDIHAAAFRYDPAVDGTAFWRAVTIAGTGASANVITTTSAITTGTTYKMNIGCTSALCSFYINGSLVATSSTTLPALGTPLGYVAQVTPTAAVFRSISWSRVAITHK